MPRNIPVCMEVSTCITHWNVYHVELGPFIMWFNISSKYYILPYNGLSYKFDQTSKKKKTHFHTSPRQLSCVASEHWRCTTITNVRHCQTWHSHKTPHTLPSGVRYGVFLVIVLEKIDHITRLNSGNIVWHYTCTTYNIYSLTPGRC